MCSWLSKYTVWSTCCPQWMTYTHSEPMTIVATLIACVNGIPLLLLPDACNVCAIVYLHLFLLAIHLPVGMLVRLHFISFDFTSHFSCVSPTCSLCPKCLSLFAPLPIFSFPPSLPPSLCSSNQRITHLYSRCL